MPFLGWWVETKSPAPSHDGRGCRSIAPRGGDAELVDVQTVMPRSVRLQQGGECVHEFWGDSNSFCIPTDNKGSLVRYRRPRPESLPRWLHSHLPWLGAFPPHWWRIKPNYRSLLPGSALRDTRNCRTTAQLDGRRKHREQPTPRSKGEERSLLSWTSIRLRPIGPCSSRWQCALIGRAINCETINLPCCGGRECSQAARGS